MPLERLSFDPRLQMRALPPGQLFVEEAAAEYAALLANGHEFPPLEVVCEDRGEKTERYWVFGGFTRGEAHRRRGSASVECLVYPGTFADARRYARGENARHGQPRDKASRAKAVADFLADPDAVRRAERHARERGEGGFRGHAAAECGVHPDTVSEVVRSLGKVIHHGKLTDPAPTPGCSNNDSGKGQTFPRVVVSPTTATPSPVPEPPPPQPARVGDDTDDGPAWTASPPEDAPLPAAPLPDHLSGKARPGRFEAERLLFDQAIRHLREAAVVLEKLLKLRGSAKLRRWVEGGVLYVRPVDRRSPRTGTVTQGWECPDLTRMVRAFRLTRPRHVCAGCGGAGCTACADDGFVAEAGPDDTAGAADLPLGLPWDDSEEAARRP
ncbi:MAG: hypothetical protein K2X87_05275 [Gemmataceae bacterium]|nr:hypothetical protein [Gemmataceae bacterium]